MREERNVKKQCDYCRLLFITRGAFRLAYRIIPNADRCEKHFASRIAALLTYKTVVTKKSINPLHLCIKTMKQRLSFLLLVLAASSISGASGATAQCEGTCEIPIGNFTCLDAIDEYEFNGDCCSLEEVDGSCLMLTTSYCYFEVKNATNQVCAEAAAQGEGCVPQGTQYFTDSTDPCPASGFQIPGFIDGAATGEPTASPETSGSVATKGPTAAMPEQTGGATEGPTADPGTPGSGGAAVNTLLSFSVAAFVLSAIVRST